MLRQELPESVNGCIGPAENAADRQPERALLETPVTYRVAYRKTGNLQFFSHLDLQRTWQRILVRAGIPMWYTQGFNPHAKIIFGVPLSVGAESLCEYVDLRIARDVSCDEVFERLSGQVTDEMRILRVYVPERSLNDIASAEYRVTVRTADAEAVADAAKKLLGSDTLTVVKRTKSGDKPTDIMPMISGWEVSVSDGEVCLNLCVDAGNVNNLNPEYIVSAVLNGAFPGEGALSGRCLDLGISYRILRLRFLDANGEVFE